MKEGSTILYMGPEDRWMLRNRKVFRDGSGQDLAQPKTFDFGGPVPLSYYHVTCNLLGACSGVVDKPLLCKVYPFFPVLSFSGELEDIYPSSIFELTFELQDLPTPCTVSSKKESYLKRWRGQPEILAPLHHPSVIFYLRAVKHFVDSYKLNFTANESLRQLSGQAFWRTWEMAYLSGKLISSAQLKANILSDYNQLTSHYGEFEI